VVKVGIGLSFVWKKCKDALLRKSLYCNGKKPMPTLPTLTWCMESIVRSSFVYGHGWRNGLFQPMQVNHHHGG
jgi:hypothetical protein